MFMHHVSLELSQFGQGPGVCVGHTQDLKQPLDGLLGVLQKLIHVAKWRGASGSSPEPPPDDSVLCRIDLGQENAVTKGLCRGHGPQSAWRSLSCRGTQVVEGLGARGVVPQGLLVQLSSLLVVLLDEHRVGFVDDGGRVVAVGGHGEVGVAVGLVVVFLLHGGRDERKLDRHRNTCHLMRGPHQEVEEGEVGGCSALHSAVLLLKRLQSLHRLAGEQ
ncbi:hypothetical protein EYF80_028898 [Liparis tanakae]|uniref:Uncharacterized protein n=1 Tax=Liparis tanakae TaxID=230148 RepID=A0A4Z2H7B3_9TELE|nr:hypothetical protein EYF80_028898 [Liparis tanakae]